MPHLFTKKILSSRDKDITPEEIVSIKEKLLVQIAEQKNAILEDKEAYHALKERTEEVGFAVENAEKNGLSDSEKDALLQRHVRLLNALESEDFQHRQAEASRLLKQLEIALEKCNAAL